jgi:hypothetical protein
MERKMIGILRISRAEDRIRRMPDTEEIENPGSKFTQVLDSAAKLPGVRINRAAYLRAALKRYCTDDQIERAISESPAAAGVSPEIVKAVANASIKFETAKVTTISAAAGIPGGFAAIGTIPADIVQYFGHVLRIAQKLAYIYSWPDLFADDGDGLDDATEGILTLFVGVMFGVQLAQAGVAKTSTLIAAQVLKKLPQKALTQGAIYPVVKKVAAYLGIRMTKQIFAGSVAKVIPVLGSVLSGGLTLATFFPMSKRLQNHLASLELTKPSSWDDRDGTGRNGNNDRVRIPQRSTATINRNEMMGRESPGRLPLLTRSEDGLIDSSSG